MNLECETAANLLAALHHRQVSWLRSYDMQAEYVGAPAAAGQSTRQPAAEAPERRDGVETRPRSKRQQHAHTGSYAGGSFDNGRRQAQRGAPCKIAWK